MERGKDVSVSKEQNASLEIKLKEGLHAYPLPELREQRWAPNIEEATQKLDTILASVKSQGGELKGILQLEISLRPEPPVTGRITKKHPFLIVEK